MDSIFTIKEREELETPVLLFECELRDGQMERWSTRRLVFEGEVYVPRVLGHTSLETQSLSDEGIDAVNRVGIVLANADSHFSQVERTVGWKGAKLTARFVFFDLAAGEPVSGSEVLFRGVANPPDEITESTFRLSFMNRLSLQRMLLPEVRIQRRCPWNFPATPEQRSEAVDGGPRGRYSRFFRCGYSADVSGGCGNLDGGNPYTTCDGTRKQCEARGMFSRDEAGSETRRFGGVEFLPANIIVRSHGEQGSHVTGAVENKTKYNDLVPLIYGTTWYEPPVVFARNDGNLTRMEVLLGSGEIQGVLKVVVNNIDIPAGKAGADMTATGWYNLISPGNRTGGFNPDFSDGQGNPLGDPYGSMAFLSVVVPNHVSAGQSIARVQVLVEGVKLERFDSAGNFLDHAFTNNPVWILLDVLRRSGWSLDEIDLPSFANAASHSDEVIGATDLYGNAVDIPRYQCNLALRKRRSAADVVRGIRNCAGLYVTYGFGGLLQLRVERTLAGQQPSLPAGSNSTQELNGGWPAYEFGDGSDGKSGILRRSSGEASLRIWSRPTADTPNRLTVEFQDEFNEYQQDSLSLVDTSDALDAGQEVSTGMRALGIPNFSQAQRILGRHLHKSIRGNCLVEFETSVRAIGLKPGDIVALTYLKEGLMRQPFRVIRIASGLNHATSKIICQWHDDAWYLDTTGHGHSGAGRQSTGELGLPRPLAGSELDGNGRPVFGIAEKATGRADGGATVSLAVEFVPPRAPSTGGIGIPLVSLTPSVDTSGGSLLGGETYYYAVSAIDGAGNESELSFVVRAAIPPGTQTNAVILLALRFPPEAAGFHVYRGESPSQLLRIATGSPLADAYVDAGGSAGLTPPPDANYDHARFYWRMERVPAHPVTSHSERTIGSDVLQMLDNEHTGAVVRIVSGTGAGQERTVLGNSAQTLTVNSTWTVEPDTTSEFVVAEGSWRFGAAATSSPAEFEIPNHAGATVHVSGRSTNAHGRECAYELSPITRWQIGGASDGSGDVDVAGQPVFGLHANGRGVVELAGIGFADLTNTASVEAGTLSVHYWDELIGPADASLGAALGETDPVLELSAPGAAGLGSLLQIGGEVLVVEEVLDGGLRYEVTRGSHDTAPEAFPAGSPVYHLRRKVFVIPFVKNFFGSPASGSFGYPLQIPDVRIAAAEFFVTNSRGNSEVARAGFTGTVDYGLRTLSGGQLSIQVAGHLAIQAGAAPPVVIQASHSVRDVFAVMKEPPTGGSVNLQLVQDGALYCELAIPDGQTQSNVVDGRTLPPLEERATLELHVVAVPQSADTTTGKDLNVIIRL